MTQFQIGLMLLSPYAILTLIFAKEKDVWELTTWLYVLISLLTIALLAVNGGFMILKSFGV